MLYSLAEAPSLEFESTIAHSNYPNQESVISLFASELKAATSNQQFEPDKLCRLKMAHLQQNSILIVDDNSANIKVLFDVLHQSGYKVSVAKSGESALLKVPEALPDLILLDVLMPGIDGFETCRRLKANPQTQEIPIIFLSAIDEVNDKVKAFAVGGVDYISKPFQTAEILARVQNQLMLQAAKAEISQMNIELEQRVEQRTAQLALVNQELQQEIAERKQAEEQLLYRAWHDALTGLANRTLLMERLESAVRCSQRQPDTLFAVLFIDLDRFKIINDSLGHQIGDQLLMAIAQQLKATVRPTDTVARLGGDEFVILLDPINNRNDAIQVAQRVAQNLQLPFQLEGRQVFTTASIGIAISSTAYNQGSDFLQAADIAMYRAKQKGKACYEIFAPAMYAQVLKQLQLENDLRQAIERQEFQVYYQPIIALDTGRLTGFEALTRWQHPEQGLVSPVEFISIAEETGLIVPLGEWILRSACQQMAIWQDKFSRATPLKISVNLSVKQLREPNFLQQVDQILAQTGIDGQNLQLEVTESMLMGDVEELIQVLSQLRVRGIQLSIDDFGTGYSCLSYLHRFPIDNLKIDRSFVSRIGEQGEHQAIVKTIITLAHQLGMKAIAEGVETPRQLNQLQALNCKEAQGYLFAKPLAPEVATALLCRDAAELSQSTTDAEDKINQI